MIRIHHGLAMAFSLSLACLSGVAAWAQPATETVKQPVKDVIPVTVANLKGQKSLYEDGWFIITSSEKALQYAKRHSIDSSADALKKVKTSIQGRSKDYAQDISAHVIDAGQTTVKVFKGGTQNSQAILAGTHNLAQKEWAYSQEAAQQAWHALVFGYMYLGETTKGSLAGLKSVPGGYSSEVREDFKALFASYKKLRDASRTNIKASWDHALEDAETDFKQAYEESGQASNSLTGLWTLLSGYAVGVYHGLFKPTATSSWQVAKYSATVAGEVVFLPIASTYILTKNTVRSAGLAVYYTGKTAIEVVAPTVKGGFLAGMSLLSAGAVPVTYVAGTTVGVINQVGTVVAAPAAGVTQGVVTGTADTLMYGALVTYDAVAGTTKVFVNQVKSGVVLGYNALTAIPSQLLLGTVNSAVFLFWDGPRLTIATLKGEVDYKGQRLQPGALPVGSIIDLKTLSQENPGQLHIITDDPQVIENVLESLPKDLLKP